MCLDIGRRNRGDGNGRRGGKDIDVVRGGSRYAPSLSGESRAEGQGMRQAEGSTRIFVGRPEYPVKHTAVPITFSAVPSILVRKEGREIGRRSLGVTIGSLDVLLHCYHMAISQKFQCTNYWRCHVGGLAFFSGSPFWFWWGTRYIYIGIEVKFTFSCVWVSVWQTQMVLRYKEDSQGSVQRRQFQHAFSRRKSDAAIFILHGASHVEGSVIRWLWGGGHWNVRTSQQQIYGSSRSPNSPASLALLDLSNWDVNFLGVDP